MRVFTRISIASLLFLTVLIWGANSKICNFSENKMTDDINEIEACETGLVLGASKYYRNGNVNLYFQYRMEAAAELYHSGKVNQLIVSGDNHTVSYDEPTDMAESLIALGVPDENIIRDYAGFRTLDSVIRAKKVFNCEKLIIVSQKFHNQRAVFAANHHGIQAQGYNAQDIQSNRNLTHLREIGAKFLMVLDLYVFNRQPKFL
jgi:SanA protein